MAASGRLSSALSLASKAPEGLPPFSSKAIDAGVTLRITASAIEHKKEKTSAISTKVMSRNMVVDTIMGSGSFSNRYVNIIKKKPEYHHEQNTHTETAGLDRRANAMSARL
jgi:hypothetical protein